MGWGNWLCVCVMGIAVGGQAGGYTKAFKMDLDTLKNVALPATGDIVVTENGQDKIVTGFGKYKLIFSKPERFQKLYLERIFSILFCLEFHKCYFL